VTEVGASSLSAQALEALQRGQGSLAAALLARASKQPDLPPDESLRRRLSLVEAHLLQDQLGQAARLLGRPPDELRARTPPALLSGQWRLHGVLALVAGEPSRAIALLGRALRQAGRAHDPLALGLAHYELARCYRQIGDTGTVREHLSKAASALHAAGDRRALALVHSLLGVGYAQDGRYGEALQALSQAERLAQRAQADDVAALVCGNQANVAMMQHRHQQALELAERSVALQEQTGAPHGLGAALASLGQICVRVGNLPRAVEVLHRALDVPAAEPFRHETTGAIYDSLAQIHLIQGAYDEASQCLRSAAEAYGEYGQQANRWYQWSLRVLEARLALRRGQADQARTLAESIAGAPTAPSAYALQGELISAEATLAAGRMSEAAERLASIGGRLRPPETPGSWAEFLRLRGRVHAQSERPADAYHDLGQSVSVFELLGERYQAGLSYLALGALASSVGARSKALSYLNDARGIFEALGAAPDLDDAQRLIEHVPAAGTGGYVGVAADDSALVRRLVDAAAMPDVLGREAVQAMQEACGAEIALVFVRSPGGEIRLVDFVGCDARAALALASAAARGAQARGGDLLVEPLGSALSGPRWAVLAAPRPAGSLDAQRFRTLCAIVRLGFDLCQARERQIEPISTATDTGLEPLLPGFICASSAMARVAEQIQRLQGNDLTVLITGESGTGKDLVARAIHAGSLRREGMFLPYNCTSATRELADSQLFGHRRGSFTGAVADQAGVLRTAAGGTLFLDEVGDLPLEVQPKLLRFLEQGEILPVGDPRPQQVDVRVIAATNADLEQRVAAGRFREDLLYRLSVIQIHVPPLRERREEIPHLSAFFLRETCERLGKVGLQLGPETLDLFDSYPWPGNVRQLRNEIQRAVALAPAGGVIAPDHLSPQLLGLAEGGAAASGPRARSQTLAGATERLERDMIRAALERAGGNVSRTARQLGVTRRGLYLKLRRLGLPSRQDLA